MKTVQIVCVTKEARSGYENEYHLPITGSAQYDDKIVHFQGEVLAIHSFDTGLMGICKAINVLKEDGPFFKGWKLYTDEPCDTRVTAEKIRRNAETHINRRNSYEESNRRMLIWENSGWEEKLKTLPSVLDDAFSNFRSRWEQMSPAPCLCCGSRTYSWDLVLIWLTGNELAAIEAQVRSQLDPEFDIRALIDPHYYGCTVNEQEFRECILDAFHVSLPVDPDRVNQIQKKVDVIRERFAYRGSRLF